MADVLPQQPQPAFTIKVGPSPIDSPIDMTEQSFGGADQSLASSPAFESDTTSSNPFPWTTDSSQGLESPPASFKHKKHKSLALPAFSFNPGAENASDSTHLTTAASPSMLDSPSTSSRAKHGHRRTRSELPGVEIRPISGPTGTPVSEMPAEENAKKDTPHANALAPTKGHKHRRSAAVSKDLTGVIGASNASSDVDHGSTSTSLSSAGGPSFHLRSESLSSAKSTSPVRSSRASDVDVSARRPLPTLKPASTTEALRPTHSSDGPESRQSRPLLAHRPATVPIPLPASFEFPPEDASGDFPSVSIVEHAGSDLSPFAFDDAPIFSDNSDDQHTLTVPTSHRRAVSHPNSINSPRPDLESVRGSDNVIDLDVANDVVETSSLTTEDLRNLRGKSFSAARRSMHSGGAEVLGIRTSVRAHRRTESAPSLDVPSNGRPIPSRTMTADTASEKGFEMENVFEEDEEDVQAAKEEEEQFRLLSRRKSEQIGLGIGPSELEGYFSSDNHAKRSSVIRSEGSGSHDSPTPTSERDIPSRTQTIRQASSNRQSMVPAEPMTEELDSTNNSLRPPTLISESNSARSSFDYESRPGSQPNSNLSVGVWTRPPDVSSFGSTPNDPSQSSAWSTPKLDTAATSVSDQPHLHPPSLHGDAYTTSSISTDGIPSLISSNSTMSGPHRWAGIPPSPSTPSGSQGRHSALSLTSQARRQSKRASIASITQLLPRSRSSGPRQNLAVDQEERCPTLGGLSTINSSGTPTPTKEKTMKRLGRALKFWKSKEDLPLG